MNKEKCPFCKLDLIKMVCPGCNREWENYEGQMISKVRKVKFKKKPEIGDTISLGEILGMNNGAMFSQDRKYRYALWRVWDKDKPLVMFIGLNPSTANETTNDQTIRRVQRFAFDWGFGGVYMMNLFDQVTSDPKKLEMPSETPPYTPSRFDHNDLWLNAIAEKCQRIIFAWGSFKEAKEKGKRAANKFGGYALGINKDGSPKHPLYVKKDVKPEIYIP